MIENVSCRGFFCNSAEEDNGQSVKNIKLLSHLLYTVFCLLVNWRTRKTRGGHENPRGGGGTIKLKSLNPDLDPDPSCFLTLPGLNVKLFQNYKIFPSKEVNSKI